jgi:adenosine kinase
VRWGVSGSVATDQLMTFDGRFAEQLLPESLAHLSVAFLVDDMQIRRGGVAGNITYGMSRLGQRPVLVAAVGHDAKEYVDALAADGVDLAGVHVSDTAHTARFVCTTDRDLNQIAAFYPGAMREAASVSLDALAPLDLVVVCPNDPAAMVAHTEQAARLGIPTVADPSQQIASLSGEQLRRLLDGPFLLITNAYEAELLEHKTGMSAAAILDQVGTRITTHGAQGVVIHSRDEPPLAVPVVPTTAAVDPTGVGDAFRAGWLTGHAAGLPMQRCVQLGTLLATLCLEAVGPQGWTLDGASADDAVRRLAAAHGQDATTDLEPLIRSGASGTRG